MANPIPEVRFQAALRTMRIIVVALAAGVAIFLGIVIYLRESGQFQGMANPQVVAGLPILTFVSLVFAAAIVVPFLVVPNAIAAAQRKLIAKGGWDSRRLWSESPGAAPLDDSDASKLLVVYQIRLLVRCALLEGAAFFLVIAYLLEGQVWCLAAAVLFLLGILVQFPMQFGVENWVQDQQQLLSEDRVAARSR